MQLSISISHHPLAPLRVPLLQDALKPTPLPLECGLNLTLHLTLTLLLLLDFCCGFLFPIHHTAFTFG
jgi:hypothetical protein